MLPFAKLYCKGVYHAPIKNKLFMSTDFILLVFLALVSKHTYVHTRAHIYASQDTNLSQVFQESYNAKKPSQDRPKGYVHL